MSELIPGTCVAIKTTIFPVLDGEKDEVINDGMYGKAVCEYLKRELPGSGVDVPSFVAEDWGWWVSVKYDGFEMGLLVGCDPDSGDDPQVYAIMSSIEKKKTGWIFKKDNTQHVTVIMDAVEGVFKRDPGIEWVKRLDDIPW